MPNNKKNNNKEIELLPKELRRPEEKKKEAPRLKVEMHVPEEKVKPKGPSFWEKFFGAVQEKRKRKFEKQKQKEAEAKIAQEERARLEVFKIKKETEPQAIPLPKEQAAVVPAPKPEPKVMPKKEAERKPKEVMPFRKGFGITLMPEELLAPKEDKLPKQIAILVAIILILGVILGGAFGFLKWRQDKIVEEIKKTEANLADANQQVQNLEEKKNQAQVLQKQLKAASKLLSQHIYWTNVFSFLEANTVADAYFMNLTGTSDGQITMSAIAKSYKALAEQIVAFREAEEVEKVFITSASANVDPAGEITEVNFDAKLKLKPEVFLK